MGAQISQESLMENRTNISMCVLACSLVCWYNRGERKLPPSKRTIAPVDPFGDIEEQMDPRRRAQIAWGKPSDHACDCLVSRGAHFDLDQTIYASVERKTSRMMLQDKLNVAFFWSDSAVMEINRAFAAVPRAPRPEKPLIEFITQECNFSVEHNDGSFMDHLNFCAHYSSLHFPAQSPRVLYLHSIMGVGTNFFPMEAKKIPKLQALLTENEYLHVEAFPTILRLINHGRLLEELAEHGDIRKLESITYHRVLDNAELKMSMKDFVDHLNFHIIHMLDFLPTTNWGSKMDDPFLHNFIKLHKFMEKMQILEAHVDFDITSAEAGSDGLPLTLASFLAALVPASIKMKAVSQAAVDFSARIGHSLDYRLEWQA